MSVNEILFIHFKSEVAQSAFEAVRVNTKALDKIDGILTPRFGHVLRVDDTDVPHEYRGFLEIEWNWIESFTTFFPNSLISRDFFRVMMPLGSHRSMPMLFLLGDRRARSESSSRHGLTQIFTWRPSRQVDVDAYWSKRVEGMMREKENIQGWSGWGLGPTEGSFASTVDWRSLEDFETGSREVVIAKTKGTLRYKIG
ncbi:hypothetical protein SVAN01_09390 [Stagonosporopsis vannaccii]|nr:hypothetical protein SVAN01_09390 [Stagonosporopsis vannaccii]